MALDEFALIRRYFHRRELTEPAPAEVVAGIGDDCALLSVNAGQELAVSMDLLLEGVHFPRQCDARLVAQRALRVNISDLTAMGAEPVCFTLGLSLPEARHEWLQAFSEGLADVASETGCVLVGGDVTRGPLSVCMQVHGRVPEGKALRRSGAMPGDDVYVTGTLGDAAAALPLVLENPASRAAPYTGLTPEQRAGLEEAYYRPGLQIRWALALRGLASAAIDLSDGLSSDLSHILEASAAGAVISLDRLPLSPVYRRVVPEEQQWSMAVSGGDDYGLCFTAPRVSRNRIEALSDDLDVMVTRIGHITPDAGLRWLEPDGNERTMASGGYRHFGGSDTE